MGNRGSARLCCPSETDLADFLLTDCIGIGTFGKVFSVLHRGMRKEYALKVMCKRRLIRRRAAEGVLRELAILQTLSHPFIANLWFSFQDSSHIYMIFDLLPGGDLAFHLRQHGRFSESRAKLLICEIALALDYLHRQRIGHFDVKPANILLGEEGHAHLADFGLSRRLGPGQLATSFSGTRPYMAPEILLTALGQSDGYSLEVDWWALGVCFYELLRGRLPTEYPSSFSSLQVLNIIYTRSVVMSSRWPSDLISFLRALIKPEPELRICSFSALCSHPYMCRIEWQKVFERRVEPIFAPSRGRQAAVRRDRRSRATVSAPMRGIRTSKKHKGPMRRREQSADESGNSNTLGRDDEEREGMARLGAEFKQYNRFRCEVRPAEPRLSLAVATGSRGEKGTAETTKGTRVERMRMRYQSNNREVNYSM